MSDSKTWSDGAWHDADSEWTRALELAPLRDRRAILENLLRERAATLDVDNPPEFVQPQGAHDAYLPGSVVTYQGKRWRNGLDMLNVWPPGTQNAGWIDLDAPDPADPQPWVQPTGAHDAYPVGAIVTHKGQTWMSAYAANTWEPGVFGWTVVP